MNKQTEALKLALEALELFITPNWAGRGVDEANAAYAAIREALAEQPAQPKYRRGDRLICLETEEYCVIHISGTDRQWVKFPDAHICVYKNEQLAELFELLPKEIEIEQPVQHRAWFTVDELNAWADKKLKENPQWAEQPARVAAVNTSSERVDEMQKQRHDTSPPASKPWVGLTDEDCKRMSAGDKIVAMWADRTLKEKNT